MSKFAVLVTLCCVGFVCGAKADCGANKRELIIVQNPNLIAGDVWNGNGGVIATFSMCGGCAIVNFPGGSYNDAAYPFTANVEWGDGASSPLTINTNGTLTGSHKYSSPVNAGSLKVTTAGQCVNPQRNWHESVDNYCSTWAGNTICAQHPAAVSVFAPMQPTAVSPTITPIKHGSVNSGALAVFLSSPAPASGMTMKVSSPNVKVKFAMPGQASSNPAVIAIPAGNSAFNFDLDTTLLASPATVRVDAASQNDPQPSQTKQTNVQIQ